MLIAAMAALKIVFNVIVILPARKLGVILVSNTSQQIVHALSALIIVLIAVLQENVPLVVLVIFRSQQLNAQNAVIIAIRVWIVLNANLMDVLTVTTLSMQQPPVP